MCAYQVVTACLQTRDQATKQLQENKKSAEAQWNAAQKQYQKASPSNQKTSKKAWGLAEKARDEVGYLQCDLCALDAFAVIPCCC